MKKFLFILFVVSNGIFGQQKLNGKIVDSTGLGIEFVNVSLLKSKDSSFVVGTLTDNSGNYHLEYNNTDNLLIHVFAVGYQSQYISPESVNGKPQEIYLRKDGVDLGEINVVALRKQIEFKNGNVTVHIEDSPLATGNSIFQLLVKLPGVTIDENNVISIQGRSGVRIYIDDRAQLMSGAQLVNFLKSMNASAVSSIEILKNPPAKMDASGSGGIINIKTKKASIKGLCGSLDYSYSQGFYDMHSGSASLNYRGEKIIFYSNFNFESGYLNHDHYFIKKLVTDTQTTIMDQHMAYVDGGNFFGGRMGLDWLVNPKNTIGVKVTSDLGKGIEKTDGFNSISNNDMGFSKLKFNSLIENPWMYSNYNLFFEHKLDTLGSNLLLTADYSPNYDLYTGNYKNWFLDSNYTETMPPLYYKNKNELTNNIISSKLDYTKKFSGGYSFEAGAKGTVADMNSDYYFKTRNNTTGEYSIDSLYSNAFSYHEEVVAGYMNVSREWKSLSIQAGLRGENTNVVAKNYNNTFHYTRSYFNLFPVASINYSKSENHNWQLSYNRRIDRPYYASFNPYLNRISVYQSQKGNPNLVPEYSNNLEFTHTFKGIFTNAISYSIIDHYLMDLTLQNDTTRETTAYIDNLNYANRIGYSVFLNTSINKWWNITINGSASYLKCKGELLGQKYSSTGYFYMATMTNEFLVKSTKVEINARYIGPRFNGIWNNGAKWGVYLAVKRSFLNEKLNVTMAFDDIFFSMIGSNSIKALNQDWSIHATNDTRRLVISLNYNFGKIKVEERNVNSNEEEKGRLGK